MTVRVFLMRLLGDEHRHGTKNGQTSYPSAGKGRYSSAGIQEDSRPPGGRCREVPVSFGAHEGRHKRQGGESFHAVLLPDLRAFEESAAPAAGVNYGASGSYGQT